MVLLNKNDVYSADIKPLTLPEWMTGGEGDLIPPLKGRHITVGEPLEHKDVDDAKDDLERLCTLVSSFRQCPGFAADGDDLDAALKCAHDRLAVVEAENSSAVHRAVRGALNGVLSKMDDLQKDVQARVDDIVEMQREHSDEIRGIRVALHLAECREENRAKRENNKFAKTFSPLCFTETKPIAPPIPLDECPASMSEDDVVELEALRDEVLQGIPPRDPTGSRVGLCPAYIGDNAPNAIFPRDRETLLNMTELQVWEFVTWYNTNCGIELSDSLGGMIQNVRRFIGAS